MGPGKEHSSWCQHVGSTHSASGQCQMLWTCQDGQGHLRQQDAAREVFLEEGEAEAEGWREASRGVGGEDSMLGQKVAKAELRALADFWNTEELSIVEGT